MLALLPALILGAQAQPFASYGLPFDQHTCKDKFDRTITYYLSKSTEKAPIALMIPGSGGQSIWTLKDGHVYGGLQNLLRASAKNRVRVLIVEKPGVPFAFQPPQPGTAEGCPEEFLKEHTLDRWAEANEAALRDAWKQSGVDASKALVIGHSEGGIVAAKVAADEPTVTHLASLAGGGPSQLFDLQKMIGEEVDSQWKEILKDPDSITKFAYGHPFRRWSSFLKTSTMEQALRSSAKIYIAQGTADKNSYPLSADIFHTNMVASGRNVTYEKIEGADHGFSKPGAAKPYEGFQRVLEHVLDWFLK